MRAFFQKWFAFFRPIPGWKQRYLSFRAGNTAWDVPNRPDCDRVVPFPVEWIPNRLIAEDSKTDTEADIKRGFVFLDCTCIDSGKEAPIGVGVRCCRCGVPLHPDCANMVSGFDPPYCSRCKWPIILTGR